MKIAQLNCSFNGSPGTLMKLLSDTMNRKQIENRMYYTFGTADSELAVKYSTDTRIKFNALRSRITGKYGFVSNNETTKLISLLNDFQPDLVHIHTIHGHDLNVAHFFQYLSEKQIPVVYTIHDTWPFTGYCPNYNWSHCMKWQDYCHGCPVYHTYSWFFDRSEENFNKKKEALLSLSSLTLVTPSSWMKAQIQNCFLRKANCEVIPNGIDTDVFTPVSSDLKQRLGIENQYMILSLANAISADKGLNDLLHLHDSLPVNYRLVLVGVSEQLKSQLPADILAFPRTSSKAELAEYYSNADVMVNPTHGDNFPTVNIESLACGTPVVTYDVGGSPEALDETAGMVVPEGDIPALCEAVKTVAETNDRRTAHCRTKAVRYYDKNIFTSTYMDLYQTILNGN